MPGSRKDACVNPQRRRFPPSLRGRAIFQAPAASRSQGQYQRIGEGCRVARPDNIADLRVPEGLARMGSLTAAAADLASRLPSPRSGCSGWRRCWACGSRTAPPARCGCPGTGRACRPSADMRSTGSRMRCRAGLGAWCASRRRWPSRSARSRRSCRDFFMRIRASGSRSRLRTGVEPGRGGHRHPAGAAAGCGSGDPRAAAARACPGRGAGLPEEERPAGAS